MDSVPQSKDFPACFHRVTIKGLVVKDEKILLLKESPKLSEKWELPGGGLDFGEDIYSIRSRSYWVRCLNGFRFDVFITSMLLEVAFQRGIFSVTE